MESTEDFFSVPTPEGGEGLGKPQSPKLIDAST
jgi:hypothetical protein